MLRTLAEGTHGMAVVNTNDLERGLRRMADDLSSYYADGQRWLTADATLAPLGARLSDRGHLQG